LAERTNTEPSVNDNDKTEIVMSERKPLWLRAEVERIADEEGIPRCGLSIGGCLTHPDGISRDDVVALLRVAAAIPDDRGEL
jgi:hypothetical protein